MPRRIYNPDQTAGIRARLKRMAGVGVFGLVFTALVGGVVVVVTHVAPEPPPAGLIRAVWIAESLLLAISLLDLAVVVVLWGIYQLKRADRDAEGAEGAGEFNARVANARRIDP